MFLFFPQNFTINYWIKQGADPKKIIMGMPMYGQSFSLADNGNHGLNAPTYGGGEAGESTRARGFLSYYEVRIFKLNSYIKILLLKSVLYDQST